MLPPTCWPIHRIFLGGLDTTLGPAPVSTQIGAHPAATRGYTGRRGRAGGRGSAWRGALALLLALACLASPSPSVAERLEGIEPAPRASWNRFRNYQGPIAHAGFGVRGPFLLRRLLGIFRERPGAPDMAAQPLARLERLLLGGGDFAFWIGHATLLVRMGEEIFLTDPIWSRAAGPGGVLGARRLVPPAVPIEKLPHLDFVLISHNHYDHLDVPTLEALAAHQPGLRLLAPLGNRDVLGAVEGLETREFDWGELVRFGDTEVACLPAQHWSRRGLLDERRGLWSSWAVSRAGKNFYFGGDTGLFPQFDAIGNALGPIALAALPIGAYEPVEMMQPFHLNPEEAIEAARLLGADRVLGVHFGTFDLTDEPVDEPPRRFLAAAAAAGLPPRSVWVLQPGEGRRF